MQNIDYIFKIILIGGQSVGKSSLMTRYIDQIFNDSYLSTIGVDFKIKTIDIRDKKIKLQIWDTAGQERFAALTQKHFRGAHGVICVFDVTVPKSFEEAQRYLKMTIEEYNIQPDASYLVANKTDLFNKREITQEQGSDAAKSFGVRYIETSAKLDSNVQELFNELTLSILNLVDQRSLVPIVPNQQNQLLQRKFDTQEIKNKAGCC